MSFTQENNHFKEELAVKAGLVDKCLENLLAEQTEIQPRLKDAISYTLHSGGKRLRGALVLWCCELVSGNECGSDALVAAAAIEMVHAYSLIHDDLPAMDDDDIRRGQPTCHVKFDEATAILAGDGLVTLAFELLAKEIEEASSAVKMVAALSEAAGVSGMISGQMADLEAERQLPDRQMLEYIHINKTAKMFRAACQLGALAAKANVEQMRALSEYGLKLGLSFQVADDILDINATSEQLGKTAGKDEEAGKMTYPALVGIEEARKIEKQLVDEALESLTVFDESADSLRELAAALLKRNK